MSGVRAGLSGIAIATLGERRNVRQFWNMGGGDASAALQAALDVGPGEVYFPPGTYLLGSGLRHYSNLHLVGAGPGATILRAMGAFDMVSNFGALLSNISIRDMSLDGAGIGQPLAFYYTERFLFSNLELSNGRFKGMALPGAKNGRVVNCYGHDNMQDSFSVSSIAGAHQIITGATNTTPIILSTLFPHGYLPGDIVRVRNVMGNTASNGTYIVGATTPTTLELIDSIGNGAYAPTGAAAIITNCADNGGGLIRVTTLGAHGLNTNDIIWIQNVVGTTEANNFWRVTWVNATNFDLNNSAFVNAWVSGGTIYSGTVYNHKDTAKDITFTNCHAEADWIYGFGCSGGSPIDPLPEDITYIGCTGEKAGLYGFAGAGERIRYHACLARWNGYHGFNLGSPGTPEPNNIVPRYCLLDGCMGVNNSQSARGNYTGVYLHSAYCTVKGGAYYDDRQIAADRMQLHGIWLNNADNNHVHGAMCRDNLGIGINPAGAAGTNQYDNNLV